MCDRKSESRRLGLGDKKPRWRRWRGLHVQVAAAAKLLQSCLTLCNPVDGSPPGSCPWDSPGKNTGVGCHFLLRCMKVRSESEVAQSFPTLSNPMDCSLPGSSIHGIFQARVLEWGAIAFSNVQAEGSTKARHTGIICHRVELGLYPQG